MHIDLNKADAVIREMRLTAAVWYERELIATFIGKSGRWISKDGATHNDLTEIQGEIQLGTSESLAKRYKVLTDRWLVEQTELTSAVMSEMILFWETEDEQEIVVGARR